jgi:hypothetical protein
VIRGARRTVVPAGPHPRVSSRRRCVGSVAEAGPPFLFQLWAIAAMLRVEYVRLAGAVPVDVTLARPVAAATISSWARGVLEKWIPDPVPADPARAMIDLLCVGVHAGAREREWRL